MNKRTMRRGVVAVVVGSLAVGIGIAATAESRADGGVGAYLNALEDAGVGGDSLRLEKLGEGTCSILRHGNSLPTVIQGLVSTGLAPSEAQILASTAMIDLCPDVLEVMHATPPPSSPTLPPLPSHESAARKTQPAEGN